MKFQNKSCKHFVFFTLLKIRNILNKTKNDANISMMNISLVCNFISSKDSLRQKRHFLFETPFFVEAHSNRTKSCYKHFATNDKVIFY